MTSRQRDDEGRSGFSITRFIFSNVGPFLFVFLQKARLARIRIAKASSGAAFVSKKKAAEARLAAQESGLQLDDNYKEEDIFELQHHHLLRCLEKTTVREFFFLHLLFNYLPHPRYSHIYIFVVTQ